MKEWTNKGNDKQGEGASDYKIQVILNVCTKYQNPSSSVPEKSLTKFN